MRFINATAYHSGAHLEEKELETQRKECPFCQGVRREAIGLIQENPTINLLSCKKCGAISASRMPQKEVLDKYYVNYYDHPGKNKITCDNPKQFIDHLEQDIDKEIFKKPIINILDFGGGDGTIALGLATKIFNYQKKINILVVDFNTDLKKTQTKNIKMKLANRLPQTGQYDIVLASAIIEHSPRPAKDLRNLFVLLAKKGIFYARTPYVVPVRKLAKYFGIEIDFTYPGHLHDLGPNFWNNLFNWLPKGKNFKIIKSRPSIVETSLSHHFFRTIIASSMKFPWLLLKNRYPFVGGWEIFVQRKS